MAHRLSLDGLSRRRTPRAGAASSLVEASLAAIADPARQGAVAFTEVFADEARAQAAALEADDLAAAALAGAPLAVKGLFDVAGHRTAAGAAFAGPPAVEDAAAVAILRRAGLIPVGHTNMTEFAFSGLGLNPHHGTPLSPWRRAEQRVAGGSTSGGAVAVAEGMALLALGSDTGGSCRIPAAFCNVTGFKPTQDRAPRAGMVPLSPTLDAVGWIAGGVEDCMVVDRLFGGEAPSQTASLRDLRFAIPAEVVMTDLDPEVEATFMQVIARLRDAGVPVRDLSIPELDTIATMNGKGGFPAYEAYAWHRDRLAAKGHLYDPRVRTRIERGRAQSPADYAALRAARAALIRGFETRMADVDVLLFPTVAILPPKLSDLTDDDAYARLNLRVLRNSTVVNMVDGCAISIPVDPDGPPIGVTLAAPAGHDGVVLAAAKALEGLLRE